MLPFRVAGVMFQICVSEDYSYRFCLTPKLSDSSLSYRDLFLDEATDKVVYDCMSAICSAHLAFFEWLIGRLYVLNFLPTWLILIGAR